MLAYRGDPRQWHPSSGWWPPPGSRRCAPHPRVGDDRAVVLGPRTFDRSEFDVSALVDAKGTTTVSVCIPARNEGRTVGAVVTAALATLGPPPLGVGLVDELLVVDDGSTDDTGAAARAAGASVLTLPDGGGKGQAMRAGVKATVGDLVVFLDADVENTSERFVVGLLGPLLTDPEIALTKGFYERPLHGNPTGGGRVTQLVALPVIQLLFPELSGIHQPLAGETAAHRWVFENISLADGYGVEVGLLIDVAREFGRAAIAQVDLGVRVHRNRPLDELRPQAVDVLRTALGRSGLDLPG